MTRTKTTKLVAIIMAVFMAFAFMSFSLTYVSAENEDTATAGDTANPGNEVKAATDQIPANAIMVITPFPV